MCFNELVTVEFDSLLYELLSHSSPFLMIATLAPAGSGIRRSDESTKTGAEDLAVKKGIQGEKIDDEKEFDK
jgi:hypothetical protein